MTNTLNAYNQNRCYTGVHVCVCYVHYSRTVAVSLSCLEENERKSSTRLAVDMDATELSTVPAIYMYIYMNRCSCFLFRARCRQHQGRLSVLCYRIDYTPQHLTGCPYRLYYNVIGLANDTGIRGRLAPFEIPGVADSSPIIDIL